MGGREMEAEVKRQGSSIFEVPEEKAFIIAGPCSAESESQVVQCAVALSGLGSIHALRAGIWKPRTRPGTFEGMGHVGLEWLKSAKAATGLPVAVEVANVKHVYEALKTGVDILWIGGVDDNKPILRPGNCGRSERREHPRARQKSGQPRHRSLARSSGAPCSCGCDPPGGRSQGVLRLRAVKIPE